MNQNQPYMAVHSSHVSASQPYGSLPASGGYQQGMMQHQGSYPSTPAAYSTYPYNNGVMSPQSAPPHPGADMGSGMHNAMLPHLPSMQTATGTTHGYGTAPYMPQQQQVPFDTSGQVAPPGMKPRVTATLWEDEGSLCFQVEAKGVCVARREDNHFINGTKLLNVAGMTRGRRDGILKSEKTRNVVKIGPMHLKGVWIPYERALEFANREKITDQLYPLFVHNIGGLLYDPQNANRTNAVVSAADRRRVENAPVPRPIPMSQPPSLPHSNTITNPVGAGNQHPVSAHVAGRPSLDRAHTFPTPPTSASSVIGNGGSAGSYSDWNAQNMGGPVTNTQPLSIDTGLSNAARSMPTTPATTPPGNAMPSMQSYQTPQGFDSKQQYYSGPPSQPSYPTQPSVDRYGPTPSNAYIKNEMGPPSARGQGMSHALDQNDFKADHYAQRPTSQMTQHTDGDTDNVHEHEYASNGNGTYGADRASYAYGSASNVSTMSGEHSQMSPAMNGSPNQHPPSGQVTPRTTSLPQPAWSGYNTPPRQAQSSNLYNIMDSRIPNGSSDGYGSHYTASAINGTPGGTKRGREDDDHDYTNGTTTSGLEPAFDLKRRRTIHEDNVHSPVGGMTAMQAGIKAGGGPRRR